MTAVGTYSTMPEKNTKTQQQSASRDKRVHAPDPLAKQIASLTWWHHIRLGPYLTPGRTDYAHQEWIASNLPANLSGARVLDVGAWDGYFSFLAEERGAQDVIAIDNFQNPEEHKDALDAFRLARAVKQSHVEYRVLDVDDAMSLGKKFDIILFLGVYYHLRNPIGALTVLHDILAVGGIVFIEGLVRHGSKPLLQFYGKDDIEPTTYCGATVSGVQKMCEAAGFSASEVVSISKGSRLGAVLYSRIPMSLRSSLSSKRKAIGLKSAIPRAILRARA